MKEDQSLPNQEHTPIEQAQAGMIRLPRPMPCLIESSTAGKGQMDSEGAATPGQASSNNQIQHGQIQGEILAISNKLLLLQPISAVSANDFSQARFLELQATPTLRFRLAVQLAAPQKTSHSAGSPSALLLAVTDPASQSALHDLLALIRKNQHIDLCQTQDVEASDRRTGFENIELLPCALPDFNWDDIDTSQKFLGKAFAAPLLITGMTGGVEKGALINERLSAAAARWQIPMGVGSQRLALDNSDYERIFKLKSRHPRLFLIGNLGISQLATADFLSKCQRAVDMIDADALAIHINILQELVQEEGDRNFRGLWGRLEKVCAAIQVPIMVKEVGCGVDAATALRLANIGVKAIDVGGRGGTSWAHIEGQRSASASTQRVAQTFRNWGIPTAQALKQVAALKLNLPLIATGGMRDGLMAAKAVALGASLVGIGLPLLRAALESEQAVDELLGLYIRELKTAMMVCGAGSLPELAHKLASSQSSAK